MCIQNVLVPVFIASWPVSLGLWHVCVNLIVLSAGKGKVTLLFGGKESPMKQQSHVLHKMASGAMVFFHHKQHESPGFA